MRPLVTIVPAFCAVVSLLILWLMFGSDSDGGPPPFIQDDTKPTTIRDVPTASQVEEKASAMHECRDRNTQCKDWAQLDQCVRNQAWMVANCPVSCGVCKSEAAAAGGVNVFTADAQKHDQLEPVELSKCGPNAVPRWVASALLKKDSEACYPVDSFDTYGTSAAAETHKSQNLALKAIKESTVYQNVLKFAGALEDKDSMVFAVMVHKRAPHFRAFVQSLSQVNDIGKAILVVSQDAIEPEISKIIDSIDFMLVIRIFLPASPELHSTEFPGTDPLDCPVKKGEAWYSPSEAKAAGCQNAAYPDMYGHYREANFAVIKHHWYWKASFIFDSIAILKPYNGYVFFLEEDHYLSPDAVSYIQEARNAMGQLQQKASIIGLGSYKPLAPDIWELSRTKIAEKEWHPTTDNMGMGFARATWNKMKSCRDLEDSSKLAFCTFDDYNWDWSIFHLSKIGCFGNPLRVLQPKAPRAFHTGTCGVHQSKKKCTPAERVEAISQLLSAAHAGSHERAPLEVVNFGKVYAKQKPNGGWGDIRDHALCTLFATSA